LRAYKVFPRRTKKQSGVLLRFLKSESEKPWLIGGDFNLMVESTEKKGGGVFDVNEADILRSAVQACDLVDMGFVGYEFTWSNNIGGEGNIQERLDRFLANGLWKAMYPGSFVTHLTKRRSDHLPLLMSVAGPMNYRKDKKKRKLFRFEEMWLRDEQSEVVVNNAWHIGGGVEEKLRRKASELSSWSKVTFGDFAKQMRECKTQMQTLMEVFAAYFESLFLNGDNVEPQLIVDKASMLGIRNDEGNPVSVKELIKDGQWNETLVRSIFTANAADGILQIPIPMFEVEDEWEWSLAKHGGFTVRNAYYAGLQENDRARPATQVVENRTLWQSLWKIHAPPKVKVFGWKVLHGGISVKEKLRVRGMEVDVRCLMCGSYEESILHMLVRHPEVELIWQYSPLRLEFMQGSTSSFKGWVDLLLQRFKDVGWWSLFWTIAWGIWLKRNMWVFSSKRNKVQRVIQKAVTLVAEYDEANKKQVCAQVEELNTDAGIFNGGWIGLGAVVRDYVGDPFATTCWRIRGNLNADIAEALADRHGLRIALEASLNSIILETDSLKLFHYLKKGKRVATWFGKIVHDISMLSNTCRRFTSQ
ncbi:hypothetical protein RDABS01_001415, partial [Bienertia sinuspersici]